MDAGTLTTQEFEDFSTLINRWLGIKMPPTKRVMLQSRLQRRVRELGLASLSEYHARFFADTEAQRAELEHLLNLATTNKTDFFREPDHFEFLAETVVPEWLGQRPEPTFRVWCAGCATGEEAYTLAMVLQEQRERGGGEFSILATDVSTRVLHVAMEAIYAEEHAQPIPPPLRTKYLLRSRDRQARQVRITPALRRQVRFGHLNFLSEEYGIGSMMDVVFFRNVMIYFERDTQCAVVRRILRHLRPGGYLFIAHAETLQGFDLPLQLVAPSVFRHVSKPTSA